MKRSESVSVVAIFSTTIFGAAALLGVGALPSDTDGVGLSDGRHAACQQVFEVLDDFGTDSPARTGDPQIHNLALD